MTDALRNHDREYSLAEAAILSQPALSTSTLPDVLAQSDVLIAGAPPPPPLVTIRKRGWEMSVEFQEIDLLPQVFVKSVRGVLDLLSLPAAWDSYSAKPIAPRNAIQAIKLLADLLRSSTPAPAVVPTVQGGIQLEWHTKGVNIEVYVDTSEDVSFFAERVATGESCEQLLAGHEGELLEWLARISEE